MNKPIRHLTYPLHKGHTKAGRNHQGRQTIFHRGGGHKKRYRLVDFRRSLLAPARVLHVHSHDPNRTAKLALISYRQGCLSFILAPALLNKGDVISFHQPSDESNMVKRFQPGDALLLASAPVGSIVHNIELKPGRGGQIARAAGSYAKILARPPSSSFSENGPLLLRGSRGALMRFSPLCTATLGSLAHDMDPNQSQSKEPNRIQELKNHLSRNHKAGQSRWKNARPIVRGVAMNPVDHPHGGGEGKSGSRRNVNPWGNCPKGAKTTKVTRRRTRTHSA